MCYLVAVPACPRNKCRGARAKIARALGGFDHEKDGTIILTDTSEEGRRDGTGIALSMGVGVSGMTLPEDTAAFFDLVCRTKCMADVVVLVGRSDLLVRGVRFIAQRRAWSVPMVLDENTLRPGKMLLGDPATSQFYFA